ncbi:uncharacterized protein LOC110858450 isoform X2 [Folsomia candida]|uniref:uncharacterized protein LOC110858450 isoform X2 n=1 Tax=Folsomia candida TaxID=158441 RepID=UPI000B8FD79E|nr:uncharacterized protein LOC110858450 isoform X2 [Folsomia candida]
MSNSWFPLSPSRHKYSRRRRSRFATRFVTFLPPILAFWEMSAGKLALVSGFGSNFSVSSTMKSFFSRNRTSEGGRRNVVAGGMGDEQAQGANDIGPTQDDGRPLDGRSCEFEKSDEDTHACEVYIEDEKVFDQNGNPIFSENVMGPWLRVPHELGFSKDDTAKVYIAKIQLKNISPLMISYKVVSTLRNTFHLTPSQGMLPPKQSGEVLVTSVRLEDPFDKLMSASFIVFATPIVFDSQTSDFRIKILWKAYGSSLFPLEAAESHLIHRIVPEHDAYVDGFSIMEKAFIGNYVMPQQQIKGFLAKGGNVGFSNRNFIRSWLPKDVGPGHASFVDRLRHMAASVMEMQSDLSGAVAYTRFSLVATLGIGLWLFVLRYTSWIKDFGANGAQLVMDELKKPDSGFWGLL